MRGHRNEFPSLLIWCLVSSAMAGGTGEASKAKKAEPKPNRVCVVSDRGTKLEAVITDTLSRPLAHYAAKECVPVGECTEYAGVIAVPVDDSYLSSQLSFCTKSVTTIRLAKAGFRQAELSEEGKAVRAGLLDRLGPRAFGIRVHVRDGEASMWGSVRDSEDKITATEVAAGVAGIRFVKNSLIADVDVWEKFVVAKLPDYDVHVARNLRLEEAAQQAVNNALGVGFGNYFEVAAQRNRVFLVGFVATSEDLESALAAVRGIDGVGTVTASVQITNERPQ